MTQDEFKQRLTGLIQISEVNRVGVRKAEIVGDESTLLDYVSSQCLIFLSGGAADRHRIEELMSDNYCHWYFTSFVDRQIEQVRGPGDKSPLFLGLAATAISGVKGDTRDTPMRCYDLYKAGFRAGIPHLDDYFETVSKVASTELRPNPRGLVSVSSEIARMPADGPRSLAVEESDRVRRESAGPAPSPFPPLIDAALRGNLPEMLDLIQKGADVNATCETPFFKGISALAMAAFSQKTEAVEFLLNAGATTNVRPQGMSLIEWSALGNNSQSSTPTIELLKKWGATI